ncbi:protein canopy 4-like [Liolophura sinensis]|uniref:protein canopy 4-like n=1 Tax=Liolophura sinensis TaxID=3198878 RepID=UPI00315960D2
MRCSGTNPRTLKMVLLPSQFSSWTLLILVLSCFNNSVQDDSWVKDPSMCEVCKFLATELNERLVETGKSKEVLETGHGLDERNKKKFKYNTSELRLTEALQDPHICERILEYNVHAEREGSLRYAKGRSQTMDTLHGLKDKGVKVELGIPYELWDAPSAEVTSMQKKCYHLVEKHEEDIEEWYFHNQKEDIMSYLCRKRVLTEGDQKCLDEKFVPKDDDDEKKNRKGDTGSPSGKKKEGKKKKTKDSKDASDADKSEKKEKKKGKTIDNKSKEKKDEL